MFTIDLKSGFIQLMNTMQENEGFHSRSSTDLNQPYIHLTIKSIINHCGMILTYV